jgi:hypothetical protein
MLRVGPAKLSTPTVAQLEQPLRPVTCQLGHGVGCRGSSVAVADPAGMMSPFTLKKGCACATSDIALGPLAVSKALARVRKSELTRHLFLICNYVPHRLRKNRRANSVPSLCRKRQSTVKSDSAAALP